MAISDILAGGGEVTIDGVYLSVRLVREAIERKYRLMVLEESPNHLQCRIIRSSWFFELGTLFYDAIVDIIITKRAHSTILSWTFKWPEYYWVLILSSIAFLMGFIFGSIVQAVCTFALAMLLCGLFAFFEAKVFSSRLRKIFRNL